jgi:hypothetical protein
MFSALSLLFICFAQSKGAICPPKGEGMMRSMSRNTDSKTRLGPIIPTSIIFWSKHKDIIINTKQMIVNKLHMMTKLKKCS